MAERQSILGDIAPAPDARDQADGAASNRNAAAEDRVTNQDVEPSMNGGSQDDEVQHSGSRDVTGRTTSGTEVGGTRNYRTGTGATGMDIGQRPE